MNSAADQTTGGVMPDARLPDVSELSLRTILGMGHSLGRALGRLAWESHSDENVVVAFGNFAPEYPEPPALAV